MKKKAIFHLISRSQTKCQKFSRQKIYLTENFYAKNLVCKKFGRGARSNFWSLKFIGIKVDKKKIKN